MPTNNYSDNSFDDQASLDDEQLWDLLSLYVDGEADPEQAAIVERMLSSDPAYRRDFDFLMASSKTMHMLEEVEPPASLRETVLAKTSRRPTLVGRLRAAWNRATAPASPAFGRYAAVGGAFAVAAIGAVIFWPHQNSVSGIGSHPIPVTVQNTHEASPVAETPLQQFILPDFTFSGLAFGGTAPAAPLHPKVITPVTPKAEVAKNSSKTVKIHDAARQNENKMVKVTPTAPRNYTLPKNNTPRLEVSNNPNPNGYPYSKHMDEGVARHEQGTIAQASGNDFGPKVVAYEEPTTPTPDGGVHTAVPGNNNGDGVKPTPPVDTPKPTVRRVAVLPPDVKYSLTAEALRPKQNPRFDNFDRSVADSGQHRDVMTLYKSSF